MIRTEDYGVLLVRSREAMTWRGSVVKVGGGLQEGGGPRCFGTAFSSWQAVVLQRRLGVSRKMFAIREHVFPLSVV